MLTARDVVMHALQETGALTGQKKNFASTGFEFLDKSFGGISGGEIMVVGSRPNVGKTGTLLHIANVNSRQHYRPFFLSLEDSPTIIGERLQSPHTQIPLGSLRVDGYTFYKSSTIDALTKRRWEDVLFEFGAVRSLDAIKDIIRRAVLEQDRDMVIIDYLTKIYAAGHPDMRTMVMFIVNELRELCVQLNVPLFIGAQLSRPQWSKELHKFINEPELASLKESATIEESVDLISLSWAEDGVRYTKIAKNKYCDFRPTWEWSFARDGSIATNLLSTGNI